MFYYVLKNFPKRDLYLFSCHKYETTSLTLINFQ